MNSVIMPNVRDSRKIKKRIASKELTLIVKAIERYLRDGEPCKPMGRRIDSYKNQYRIPQYRLRAGDYRVLYNVEEGVHFDTIFVLDIIPKHMNALWLKKHGVKK